MAGAVLTPAGTILKGELSDMKRSNTIVFVSGPYRSDTVAGIYNNIHAARKVSERLWELGFTVLCPHLNSQFMDGIIADFEWLKRDLVLLSRCDEMVLVPGWRSSIGSCGERDFAVEKGIQILEAHFSFDDVIIVDCDGKVIGRDTK